MKKYNFCDILEHFGFENTLLCDINAIIPRDICNNCYSGFPVKFCTYESAMQRINISIINYNVLKMCILNAALLKYIERRFNDNVTCYYISENQYKNIIQVIERGYYKNYNLLNNDMLMYYFVFNDILFLED